MRESSEPASPVACGGASTTFLVVTRRRRGWLMAANSDVTNGRTGNVNAETNPLAAVVAHEDLPGERWVVDLVLAFRVEPIRYRRSRF